VSLGGGAEVAEFACAGGGGVEAEGHSLSVVCGTAGRSPWRYGP
jgi:hypothetical protein